MTNTMINDITRQEIVVNYLEKLIASCEATRLADQIYFARTLKAQLEVEKDDLTMLKNRVAKTEFNV